MAAFVLDCSVAMSWVFPDERTPDLLELRERFETESVVVPWLWHLEVANVLSLAQRRRRIAQPAIEDFFELAKRSPIETDTDSAERAFTHLLPLARQHGLTIYDAAYLDLALRRGIPLATLDDDLRRAAADAGIRLLGR